MLLRDAVKRYVPPDCEQGGREIEDLTFAEAERALTWARAQWKRLYEGKPPRTRADLRIGDAYDAYRRWVKEREDFAALIAALETVLDTLKTHGGNRR